MSTPWKSSRWTYPPSLALPNRAFLNPFAVAHGYTPERLTQVETQLKEVLATLRDFEYRFDQQTHFVWEALTTKAPSPLHRIQRLDPAEP